MTEGPEATAGDAVFRVRLAVALAAIAALLVTASACSTTKNFDIPTQATPGSAQHSALAYSACMRSHGVDNFPDPGPNGALVVTPSSCINFSSPQYQSALRACQNLAPQGPAAIAAATQDVTDFLNFAVCMQHHGFPDFPEPKLVGSTAELLRPPTDSTNAWDPNSPLFKAAWHTCAHYQPYGQPSYPPPNGPSQPPAGGAI